MKLVELHSSEVDGEMMYFTDIPMSAAPAVQDFEESGNKDFTALAQLLKIVVKEADGKPYKQFKKHSAEELADLLPVKTSMELFTAIAEKAMGNA